MRQELEERISILEQSGVISKKVADYSRRAAELVLAEAEDAAQEKMEMFITHLAMAGKRAEEGTEENPMDPEILESLREEPVYERAVRLRDRLLEETDLSFPKAEQDFLSVHICNLLS